MQLEDVSSNLKILTASWEGLCLKYIRLLTPEEAGVNLIVQSLMRSPLPLHPPKTLDLCFPTADILQIKVCIHQLEQILSIPSELICPVFYQHKHITEPSLLHLIGLLRAEMEEPQPASQILVSSIVTVLVSCPEARN
ncbi:MAG: hypothetical protein MUF49_12075 [Oculatellaceae cyanobacterium Prado106]|nr:hypothetical protein [Oculatellaceae cyanobacterium Prado106]